ncbi:sugar phosphate isomerase/epimerase [Maritimibacter sp. DP1N21-5]|uniref:sugar phosphate isomerase/epimerase family protein n=1 Tax=Maritimibacter sp. DP1N21-5 TaxID=2836867 RepID=UPI001C47D6A7|nr:TIM barrel protein [Maritimibacter sp. DP1N21-5]MBV7407430.1 sugar phosphate isomerase/epimerase [Maritimibacter sp. DP1N21-5]
MDRLCLHQLAAAGSQPEELVDIAAQNGVPAVSLFVTRSARSGSPFVETETQAKALRAQADRLGVEFYGMDVFSLPDSYTPDMFDANLDVAAILGGKRITVTLEKQDLSRARDTFDAFALRAKDRGIEPHLEFHAFGLINTLPQAEDFLLSIDYPATISADILHFYRNEGGLESLYAPRRAPIGHGQLCDGPLSRPEDEWLHEAVADRRYPGDGEFDVIRFLRGLPDDVRIDIEAPCSHPRLAGWTPAQKAAEAIRMARIAMAAAFEEA